MPADRETLLALRHRYRRAYTSYLSCVTALSKAVLNGERPTQKLLDQEGKTLQEMIDARAALLAAID